MKIKATMPDNPIKNIPGNPDRINQTRKHGDDSSSRGNRENGNNRDLEKR